MESIFAPWLIWFMTGVLLAFVELMVPGIIIVFFGIGCWVVAAVLILYPMTLSQQVFLFIVASILSIVLLRKWFMKIFKGVSSDGTEADYDDFPQGARVEVTAPISPQANGRIKFRGTFWDAASDEAIDTGEIVEILNYAGNSHQVFFVKKP
ncbi:MAG: NfeD family protein [Thermodesulfobacteriota bacterium]|nr:NfeD family protein [Thermodesulfobacteriota bacterium]